MRSAKSRYSYAVQQNQTRIQSVMFDCARDEMKKHLRV
jgi:hypothetical protein